LIEHPFVDCRAVVGRLQGYEIEGMARSAAMAPLAPQRVAELLESYGEMSKEWAEVEGLPQRLGPAWAELRSLLNELNGVLGPVVAREGVDS
jgi:hypothetical protein